MVKLKPELAKVPDVALNVYGGEPPAADAALSDTTGTPTTEGLIDGQVSPPKPAFTVKLHDAEPVP